MLTGPQRKFCEGIVAGMSGTDAYAAAYPRSTKAAARRSASDLLTKPDIEREIQRLRDKGQQMAGSAALTVAEVHRFLGRLVRVNLADFDPERDGDLLQAVKPTEHGREYRLPDKLAAIARWCDLQGEGSEAEGQDALGQLLERVMR